MTLTKTQQHENLEQAWTLLSGVEIVPVDLLNKINKLTNNSAFDAEPEWDDERRLEFWENRLDYLEDKGMYHKTWTGKPRKMIRELKEKIAAKG